MDFFDWFHEIDVTKKDPIELHQSIAMHIKARLAIYIVLFEYYSSNSG